MNSVKVIEDCSEEKKNITIAKAKVTVFYFLYLSQWDIQLNKGIGTGLCLIHKLLVKGVQIHSNPFQLGLIKISN